MCSSTEYKLCYAFVYVLCFSGFFMPSSLSGELAFRDSVRRILKGLQNVENLSLSRDIIEILTRDPELLAYLPAAYCSLKHFTFFIMPTTTHVETMACLLMTSRNLKTLHIYIEEEDPTFTDIIHRQGYWQLNGMAIAECLNHLKHLGLIYFGGSETEMDVVRRLLESASILEEFDISYLSAIEEDAEKKMKISEKLTSFNRLSSFATIVFSKI